MSTAPRTPSNAGKAIPGRKRKFGEVFEECQSLVSLEGLADERRQAEEVKREHLSVIASVTALRKTIAQLEDKGRDATIRSREAVESVEFGYQVAALESEISYLREILADKVSEVRARAEAAAALGDSEKGLLLANARTLDLAAELERATSRVASLEGQIRAFESIVAAGAAAAHAVTPQRHGGSIGLMSSQQRAPPSAEKPRRTPLKAPASLSKKVKTPTPSGKAAAAAAAAVAASAPAASTAAPASAEIQALEESCNALSAAANALVTAKAKASVPAAAILAALEAEAGNSDGLLMQTLKAKVRGSAESILESTIVSTLYNLIALDLVVVDRSSSTVKLI